MNRFIMTIAFLILSSSSTVSAKTTTPDKTSAIEALSGQDKLNYTSWVSNQCDSWISGELPNNIIEETAKKLEVSNKFVFRIEPGTKLYVSIDCYQEPNIYVLDVHFEKINIENDNARYEYIGPVYLSQNTAFSPVVFRKNDLLPRLKYLIGEALVDFHRANPKE